MGLADPLLEKWMKKIKKAKTCKKEQFLTFMLLSPRKLSRGIMESPAYVCLSVCYHDNKIKRGRIWKNFFGKVPRGESKPKFVCGYDR